MPPAVTLGPLQAVASLRPELTSQLPVLRCQGAVCVEDGFGQSLPALEELLEHSPSL